MSAPLSGTTVNILCYAGTLAYYIMFISEIRDYNRQTNKQARTRPDIFKKVQFPLFELVFLVAP